MVKEMVVLEDEVVVVVAVVAMVVMVVVAVEVAEVMVVKETAPEEAWLVVVAEVNVAIPCPASSNGRGGRGLICTYIASGY